MTGDPLCPSWLNDLDVLLVQGDGTSEEWVCSTKGFDWAGAIGSLGKHVRLPAGDSLWLVKQFDMGEETCVIKFLPHGPSVPSTKEPTE